MYGAVPSIFKSREAAQKVAQGYSLETLMHWIVVEKTVESWGTRYKPVESSDLNEAVADGWKESLDDSGPDTIRVF